MDKNRKQDNLKCEIVQDLLPLYYDMVTSETTNEAIRDHLEQCESCRKEYDSMAGELPVEAEEISTKGKFDKVVKRQKKFWLEIVVIAVLLTGVISALYYNVTSGVFKVPVIGGEEMAVQHIYRYKDEYGYYNFYIQYTCPAWEGIQRKVDIKRTFQGNVLTISFERELQRRKYDGEHYGVFLYGSLPYCDYGELYPDVEKNDIDAIEFAGEIVWTKEENGDETVPEYVYVYDEYCRQNNGMRKNEDGQLIDYFYHLIIETNRYGERSVSQIPKCQEISLSEIPLIPREEEIVRFTVNLAGTEGEYVAHYKNGFEKRWDNDGNVTYEDYPYGGNDYYMGQWN